MDNLQKNLLLIVKLTSKTSGKPKVNIKSFRNDSNQLVAFSCISIILSQLTVLTSQYPKVLCRNVLKFIKNPKKRYISTKYVKGFELELYAGKNDTYYNQFEPNFNPNENYLNNDGVQRDICSLLMNYLTLVFYASSSAVQEKLGVFLIAAISMFQQELLHRIKKISIFDINQRVILASDQVYLCSSIYNRWDSLPFRTGSALFNQHLKSVGKFNAY